MQSKLLLVKSNALNKSNLFLLYIYREDQKRKNMRTELIYLFLLFPWDSIKFINRPPLGFIGSNVAQSLPSSWYLY